MTDSAKIIELVDRLSRITHSLQFTRGLNPAQWEALRFVGRANRMSCSPGSLADFMGCTKGTVSQTLKALEAKGLLERCRLPDDRRAVRISLTRAGEDMLAQDPLKAIGDALGPCPGDAQESLLDGMEMLLEALHRSQGLAEFGPCTECAHYRPEECLESGGVACRCAISGELFGSLETDKICADFNRGCS